jgi:hypothetical protein
LTGFSFSGWFGNLFPGRSGLLVNSASFVFICVVCLTTRGHALCEWAGSCYFSRRRFLPTSSNFWSLQLSGAGKLSWQNALLADCSADSTLPVRPPGSLPLVSHGSGLGELIGSYSEWEKTDTNRGSWDGMDCMLLVRDSSSELSQLVYFVCKYKEASIIETRFKTRLCLRLSH